MYHQIDVETSVSAKMRHWIGVCISMNNQEKNTYVRNQILTTLLEMMKTGKIDIYQAHTFDDIEITRKGTGNNGGTE